MLCTLYIYFTWNNAGETFVVISEKMAKEIVIQLIPLTLIFLISSLILKRYTELKDYVETTEQTEKFRRELESAVRRVLADQNNHSPVRLYEKFDDIDWMRIIQVSSQLDVIIHYLDDWTRHFSPALTEILKRGGTIRVILPNHKQISLVHAINTRFPKLT